MITMNSRFALRDEHTGDTICYTLVYPEEEAAARRQAVGAEPDGHGAVWRER